MVDLEIYDGITWTGSIPTLGPRVFASESAAGANVQSNSSDIRAHDIPSFDATAASGELAAVSELSLNTAPGSRATGFPTHFATEECPPEGRRDPTTATISGIPQCSGYCAGNRIIRACVDPVGHPRTHCTGRTVERGDVPGASVAVGLPRGAAELRMAFRRRTP